MILMMNKIVEYQVVATMTTTTTGVVKDVSKRYSVMGKPSIVVAESVVLEPARPNGIEREQRRKVDFKEETVRNGKVLSYHQEEGRKGNKIKPRTCR